MVVVRVVCGGLLHFELLGEARTELEILLVWMKGPGGVGAG